MKELIGQQVGNYWLTRCLSREGIVETYLGEHRHLKMIAVIKILSIQLTAEQTQLFQRKIQPVAELMHKHMVRLLDFGIQQGRPFLLQDYFSAGTLRKAHPQGTRTVLKQALSYTKRLSDALHYMHTRQIVHGDLRPENVLLGWESNVLLNDSGLVELVHTLAPTSTYPPVEAFAYLAPERFQGQLLPASDQYSLAVMVYEWLCGQTPFQDSLSQVRSGHLTGQPPALRTKSAAIPAAFEQVIMTALAKDPCQRFVSIQAFATALEQASKSASTPSPGILALAPAPSMPPLSPAAVFAAPAPPRPSFTPPQGVLPVVGSHPPSLPAQQGGMSRRALITTFTLAGIGLAAAAGASTVTALNLLGQQSATQPTPPRGTQLVGKLIATFDGVGLVDYLNWSPDGKRLATGGTSTGSTQIWDVTTRHQITASTTYKIDTLSLSHNGFAWVGNRFYVAFIDDTDAQNPLIRVRDLVGNKEVLVYQGYVSERSTSTGIRAPDHLAWSPNGQMIASLEYRTGIRVWNARTGQNSAKFQVKSGENGITDETLLWESSLAWAPDSLHLATWGDTGIIHIWDTRNGQMICNYRKHWDQHQNDQQFVHIYPDMQWSPDSTRIVSSVATSLLEHSSDGVIHVWDAHTGKEICTFDNGQPNNETYDMGWSADGKLIACVLNKNAVVWDASSGAIVTTRYTQWGSDVITWHPQRRYIASTMASTTDTGDGFKGYIWDAATGKELLHLNTKTYRALAWSPDGLQLAIGTLDSTVQIWQIWQ